MSKIKNIYARQVIDSRGNPTIEVEVTTELGNMGRAIVPSGASTGTREALELRDGDKTKWLGKSVLSAVKNVNESLKPMLIGMEVTRQSDIDNKMIELDGTDNKSKFGANAILGISLASAVAAAKDLNIPLWNYFNVLSGGETPSLPVPMLNVLNGGEHADNSIDFQEYMIFPLGAPNFNEALRWSSEVFHTLAKLLNEAGYDTAKGDEGGFAPNMKNNIEPLEFIVKAITKAGYKPGEDIYIAMDPASSEFYDVDKKMYVLKGEGRELTTDEMIKYYEEMISKYPIVSIEDGLAEQDWEGFKKLTDVLGGRVQIMGDDLFVTNKAILEQGIEKGVANSILIKPNQIGSVTETIETIKLAKSAGYTCVMSHRSGESEDTIIADFAVGLNTQQIKTGSMSRSERIAKYNQLIRISESVNTFKGKSSLGKVVIK